MSEASVAELNELVVMTVSNCNSRVLDVPVKFVTIASGGGCSKVAAQYWRE